MNQTNVPVICYHKKILAENVKVGFNEVWETLCARNHWLAPFVRNLVSAHRLGQRLSFEEAWAMLDSARFLEELSIARRLFRKYPDLVREAEPEGEGPAADFDCPPHESLERYVLGTGILAEEAAVARHLSGCKSCRGTLGQIRNFLETARWTILAEECRKLGIDLDEYGSLDRLSGATASLRAGSTVVVQWNESGHDEDCSVGIVERASRTAVVLRGDRLPVEGVPVLLLAPRLRQIGVVRFLDEKADPARISVFLGAPETRRSVTNSCSPA